MNSSHRTEEWEEELTNSCCSRCRTQLCRGRGRESAAAVPARRGGGHRSTPTPRASRRRTRKRRVASPPQRRHRIKLPRHRIWHFRHRMRQKIEGFSDTECWRWSARRGEVRWGRGAAPQSQEGRRRRGEVGREADGRRTEARWTGEE